MGAPRLKMSKKCEGRTALYRTDPAGKARSIVVRRWLKVAMNTMHSV